MELERKEAVVKEELNCLLDQHSLADISGDDEIVLNYVVGILECLSPSDDLDITEDVEPFAETMEAYIPGFSTIPPPDVGTWMNSTAVILSQPLQSDITRASEQPTNTGKEHSENHTNPVSSYPTTEETPNTIIPIDVKKTPSRKRPPTKPSHGSDDSRAGGGERLIVEEQKAEDCVSVNALRELCPAASMVELRHCLHMSRGNVEEAASLLLYRQESGTAIAKTPEARSRKKSGKTGGYLPDDETVKDSILAKYSFVDTSEDKTEHRPGFFRKEQKKMIRYREGQVVSTKGERFSETKKQESEEMKKTYVNLKPQRKYRFH